MIHRAVLGANHEPLMPAEQIAAAAGIGVEVADWTDETLPADVADWLAGHDHLVPDIDRLRHRANLLRWLLLAFHGGTWLDTDVTVTGRLDDLGDTWTAALIDQPTCCAMAYPAGHPVPVAMINHIATAAPGNNSPAVSGDHIYRRLCPSSITRVPLPYDARRRRLARGKPGPIDHHWRTTRARLSNTAT